MQKEGHLDRVRKRGKQTETESETEEGADTQNGSEKFSKLSDKRDQFSISV